MAHLKKKNESPPLKIINPSGEAVMDLKQDEGLKTLLESGKEKGYLTYSQVNEYLPDPIGVPVTAPVEAPSARPGGSVPDAMPHL